MHDRDSGMSAILIREVTKPMKQLVSLILALCLVLSCAAFAGADGLYTPGTYEATGKGYSETDPVTVRLTVDEHAITAVELEGAGEIPFGQQNFETYAAALVGRTDGAIDAVTGATITSQAIVEAVNSAKVTSNAAAVTGNTLNMKVSGILDTGGEEEGYIFMSLDDMAILTGEGNTLSVMELSVSATSDELASYAEAVNALEGNVSARLVKRITNSETAVLAKLQALVFLVTVIVLALTMICVSTTMMAVVTERRKEIGLRKALGASDNSIRMEFLGEGMFLGMLGGALGAVLGFGFAQLVSVNVFESSIYFQPLLLPVTIIVSMAVAALSCLMPIKSAVAVDPALVLKGE
mgnify:CR=1 FL=1